MVISKLLRPKSYLNGISHTNYRLAQLVREICWFYSSAGRTNQARLSELHKKYAGKRCFIMANGPSLKLLNLTLLKNEITICSNAQYLIWPEMGFAPTFLTVEDRLVAEDRAAELNAISQTTKIFARDLAYCLTSDPHTLFLNFIGRSASHPKFSRDLLKKVYWGGTVSFLNMQLAYFLGCNPIYLIGFDHDYKVPDKVVNFVITSEGDDVNHIHPEYFGKGYRWHDPNVDRMEQSYRIAKKFFDSNNVVVKNAGIGGKLEIFERVDYASLFSSPKRISL